MVKAKRGKKCKSGTPKTLFNKWKKKMNWKPGKGADAWRKVFTKVVQERSKQCKKGGGGVKKKKSSKKSKSTGKMPKTHVGLAWVRNNCGELAYEAMKEEGKKSVGKAWIDSHCPDSPYDSYIKSKKNRSLGGCACAACRRGLGGCACMSGKNCRMYV